MMKKIFKSLKLRIHIEVQSFLWFKLVILRNSLKHLSKSCKILLVVLYKININNVSSSKLLECKFSSQKLLWSFTTSGKRTIEQVKAVITSYPGLMIDLKVAGKSEIVGRQANMAAMLFSQIKGRLGTIHENFPIILQSLHEPLRKFLTWNISTHPNCNYEIVLLIPIKTSKLLQYRFLSNYFNYCLIVYRHLLKNEIKVTSWSWQTSQWFQLSNSFYWHQKKQVRGCWTFLVAHLVMSQPMALTSQTPLCN